MGILVNRGLYDGDLVTFDNLALGSDNATRSIIESHVGAANPAEAKIFHDAHLRYSAASKAKMEYVLRNGETRPDIEKELDESYREFAKLRSKHAQDPSLDFLDDPIHRKEFKILPYEIDGKNLPPNPYLGSTAAMDGLWPGYDKPEYFDEYPFLRRYKLTAPQGKVMQTFLDEHGLLFHFPETVSRYGVRFVPPPYLTNEMNLKLRQHLSTCDKLYHNTAKVKPSTTVDEARLVLSYLEDDMVAIVEDEGGRCVGVISWKDLEDKNGDDLITEYFSKTWNEAPADDMSAEDAFAYMADENRNWNYMLKSTEFGMRIVTQTTAAISHFLPPFAFKEGLGSAIYLGIQDVQEGDKLIDLLESDADGVPALIVETAHADTEYFRKILRHYRQRLLDVYLTAGTTISPEAVLDFLVDCGADGVKLGIAEGRACRTSNTGVSVPNAHVGLECGAVAYGKGYLELDGWGTSGEYIKGIAMHGVQSRQGGGAFVGRRESANPWLHNGSKTRGKYYRGMAGTDVQAGVLQGKDDLKIGKQMENRAHLHSEGAEVWVPQRSPSTVGRMLLSYYFLLASAMSYAGVRKELEKEVEKKMVNRVLRQFHEKAKFFVVSKTAAV